MTTPTTDSLLIQANDRLQDALEILTHLNDVHKEDFWLSEAHKDIQLVQRDLYASDVWKAMKEGLKHG